MALRIWNVLVEHVGVYNSKRERESFVYLQTKRNCQEYRIQGKLGFGGKFRNNHLPWYIDCYPEDSTPERARVIEVVNEKLKMLYEETSVDNAGGT